MRESRSLACESQKQNKKKPRKVYAAAHAVRLALPTSRAKMAVRHSPIALVFNRRSRSIRCAGARELQGAVSSEGA
jgi:hypothetical protein